VAPVVSEIHLEAGMEEELVERHQTPLGTQGEAVEHLTFV
jgi:hypothetical protein